MCRGLPSAMPLAARIMLAVRAALKMKFCPKFKTPKLLYNIWGNVGKIVSVQPLFNTV